MSKRKADLAVPVGVDEEERDEDTQLEEDLEFELQAEQEEEHESIVDDAEDERALQQQDAEVEEEEEEEEEEEATEIDTVQDMEEFNSSSSSSSSSSSRGSSSSSSGSYSQVDAWHAIMGTRASAFLDDDETEEGKANRTEETSGTYVMEEADEEGGEQGGGGEEAQTGYSASARKAAIARAKERVKRPLSAWILFTNERRESLEKTLTFKEKAQLMAEEYKALAGAAKESIDERVALDKQRYQQELDAAIAEELEKGVSLSGGGSGEDGGIGGTGGVLDLTQLSSNGDLVLPLARVKKVAKMDPDVKNIAKDATLALTKATELFISFLAIRCAQTASLRGAKSLREGDFIHMVHSHKALAFLRDDFPRPPAVPKGGNKSPSFGRKSPTGAPKLTAKQKEREGMAAGSHKLSAFFGDGGGGGGGGASTSKAMDEERDEAEEEEGRAQEAIEAQMHEEEEAS